MALKRKTTPAPLSNRLAESSEALNMAVAEFHALSDHLNTVSEDHTVIAGEAHAEIERLVALRDAALSEAARANRVAARVMEFVA